MPPGAQLLPAGACVEHPEFAQNHSKLLTRNSGCGGFKCAAVYCYHKLTLSCSVYMLHFFRLKQEAARQKTSSLSNYAISMCFSGCKQPEVNFLFVLEVSFSMSPPLSAVTQVRWDLGMCAPRGLLTNQSNELKCVGVWCPYDLTILFKWYRSSASNIWLQVSRRFP